MLSVFFFFFVFVFFFFFYCYFFFFQAEDGIRDRDVMEFRRVLFRSASFKHSLTLFSKFFASFPHGTCSLSVSRQYLALDGIYHPLQAAIPSNPTRQKRIVRMPPATAQDSHLLRYPVPRDLRSEERV